MADGFVIGLHNGKRCNSQSKENLQYFSRRQMAKARISFFVLSVFCVPGLVAKPVSSSKSLSSLLRQPATAI